MNVIQRIINEVRIYTRLDMPCWTKYWKLDIESVSQFLIICTVSILRFFRVLLPRLWNTILKMLLLCVDFTILWCLNIMIVESNNATS